LEKTSANNVVFCGRNVVIECKNVVLKWPFFGSEKYATCFNYFLIFPPRMKEPSGRLFLDLAAASGALAFG